MRFLIPFGLAAIVLFSSSLPAQGDVGALEAAGRLAARKGSAVIWRDALGKDLGRMSYALARPGPDADSPARGELLAGMGINWRRAGLRSDSPIVFHWPRYDPDLELRWARLVDAKTLDHDPERDQEDVTAVFALVNVDVLDIQPLVASWLSSLSWSHTVKSANVLVVVAPAGSVVDLAQVLETLERAAARSPDALKIEPPKFEIPAFVPVTATPLLASPQVFDPQVTLARLVAETRMGDCLTYALTHVAESLSPSTDELRDVDVQRGVDFDRYLQERLLANGYVVARGLRAGIEFREIHRADDGAPDREHAPVFSAAEPLALAGEPALLARAVFKADGIRRNELRELASFFLGICREIVDEEARTVEVLAPVEGLVRFLPVLAAVQAAGGRTEVTTRLARLRNARHR